MAKVFAIILIIISLLPAVAFAYECPHSRPVVNCSAMGGHFVHSHAQEIADGRIRCDASNGRGTVEELALEQLPESCSAVSETLLRNAQGALAQEAAAISIGKQLQACAASSGKEFLQSPVRDLNWSDRGELKGFVLESRRWIHFERSPGQDAFCGFAPATSANDAFILQF